METQNITVSIPRELYKRARVLAAQRDKSVSQLVREVLEELTSRDAAYQAAYAEWQKIVAKGLDLDLDQVQFDRDSLHER